MELNTIWQVSFYLHGYLTEDWYENPNREMFDIDDNGNGDIEIEGKNQDEVFDRFYNLIGTEDLDLKAIEPKPERRK